MKTQPLPFLTDGTRRLSKREASIGYGVWKTRQPGEARKRMLGGGVGMGGEGGRGSGRSVGGFRGGGGEGLVKGGSGNMEG